MSSPALWLVGDAPTAKQLAAWLPDIGVVAVRLEDPVWRLPHDTRPIGVVVSTDGTAPERTKREVRMVHERCHGGILVLTDIALHPDVSHQLLRAGAAGVLRSPLATSLSDSARDRAVMRWRRQVSLLTDATVVQKAPSTRDHPPDVVVIGSSTGGPQTLRDILVGMPFKVPVLISQHIRPGYERDLANWLTDCGAPTRVAEEGEVPIPGEALLAPGDKDMALVDGVIELREPHATAVPSVDILFQTVATCCGSHAVGFLLTGMGADGARGLLALRQSGAFTVAQRGDTCVVNGMPERARDLEASWADWTPEEIKAYLDDLRDAPVSGARAGTAA